MNFFVWNFSNFFLPCPTSTNDGETREEAEFPRAEVGLGKGKIK